jgi:hypothetical protein
MLIRPRQSVGRQQTLTYDVPLHAQSHPMAGEHEDGEEALEIHNHIPSDDAEGEEPPEWFAEHKAETDDKFRAMHDALRALHDVVTGHHRTRHDENPSEWLPEGEEEESDDRHSRPAGGHYDRHTTDFRPNDFLTPAPIEQKRLAGLNAFNKTHYRKRTR